MTSRDEEQNQLLLRCTPDPVKGASSELVTVVFNHRFWMVSPVLGSMFTLACLCNKLADKHVNESLADTLLLTFGLVFFGFVLPMLAASMLWACQCQDLSRLDAERNDDGEFLIRCTRFSMMMSPLLALVHCGAVLSFWLIVDTPFSDFRLMPAWLPWFLGTGFICIWLSTCLPWRLADEYIYQMVLSRVRNVMDEISNAGPQINWYRVQHDARRMQLDIEKLSSAFRVGSMRTAGVVAMILAQLFGATTAIATWSQHGTSKLDTRLGLKLAGGEIIGVVMFVFSSQGIVNLLWRCSRIHELIHCNNPSNESVHNSAEQWISKHEIMDRNACLAHAHFMDFLSRNNIGIRIFNVLMTRKFTCDFFKTCVAKIPLLYIAVSSFYWKLRSLKDT